MNGVEILSSAEVASEFAFNWTIFWIGFCILLGSSLIMGLWYVLRGEIEWWFVSICAAIGVAVGLILGGIIGDLGKIPTSYETHYKVTIDDSVSMNEFLDKYEILDQEGKIYTVKERE